MHKANLFKQPKNPVDQAFNVISDESLSSSVYEKSVAFPKSLFKQKKPIKDVFQVSFNETLKNKSQDSLVESSGISPFAHKSNPFKNKRNTESPREKFINKTPQSDSSEISTLISGDSSLVKKSSLFKRKKLSEVSIKFNESSKFDKSLNLSKTIDGEDAESSTCMPKSNPFKQSLKGKENGIAVSFTEDDDLEKSITDVRQKSEKLTASLSIDKSLQSHSGVKSRESTFNGMNQSSFNDDNLNHWMSDDSDEEMSNAEVENDVVVPPPEVPPIVTTYEDPTSSAAPVTSDEEKPLNDPVVISDGEKIPSTPVVNSKRERLSNTPAPTTGEEMSIIDKEPKTRSSAESSKQLSAANSKVSSSKAKSVSTKTASVTETTQKDEVELTWEEKFQKIISSFKAPQIEPPKTSKPIQPVKSAKPKRPVTEIKGYKPPKLTKPAQFATKKLYNYLIHRLEPKFGIDKFIEAEQLVLSICDTVKLVVRRKAHQKKLINDLKKEMARAGVIETTVDFYEFVIKFLPHNFRVKVVPCIQPVTNAVYPPKDVENPFDKIL